MRGSGGTEGGIGMFFAGLALAGGALWFFFDSVLVTSGGVGWITGQLSALRGQGTGAWQTAPWESSSSRSLLASSHCSTMLLSPGLGTSPTSGSLYS